MALKQFLVHLSGNQNELRSWSFEKLGVDPGSPFSGQFWENTSEMRWKWYDGTTVHTIAHLSDLTSAIKFKGGYDANTNTPNLDSSPTAGTIFQGDFYYVTVAGNFYTEAVEIGDALIANVDDPASLSDWTRVQFNVDQATETVRGVMEIATQAEVDTGTDDLRAITPLKLSTYVNNAGFTFKYASALNSALTDITRVFAGGETTYTVNHQLGKTDLVVQVYEISSGKQVIVDVEEIDANNVDIIFNGDSANNTYKVVIVG